jgi:hypothetical protein
MEKLGGRNYNSSNGKTVGGCRMGICLAQAGTNGGLFEHSNTASDWMK